MLYNSIMIVFCNIPKIQSELSQTSQLGISASKATLQNLGRTKYSTQIAVHKDKIIAAALSV